MKGKAFFRLFLKTLVILNIVLFMFGAVYFFIEWIPNWRQSLAWGPGLSDYSIPLPDYMELVRSSKHDHSISWVYDYSAEACKTRRQYGYNTACIILIDSDITELGWNERYIVCFQSYSERSIYHQMGWWIIDTDLNTITGPLPEDEYRQKAEELGIDDLKIKSPDSWIWHKVHVKP